MGEFQKNGIVIEGVKYQFMRGDRNIALGKNKGVGAISMQATKTAVVIGHTKEGGSQGNTNKGVGVIAEYLESLGMSDNESNVGYNVPTAPKPELEMEIGETDTSSIVSRLLMFLIFMLA